MADRRQKERRRRNRPTMRNRRGPDRRRGERRHHERVAAEIMVEVATSGRRTYRRTGNISLGGLAFHAPIPFREGSAVALELRLAAEGRAVPVSGRVVGTDARGRGTRVKFDPLDPALERLLLAHLELFDAPTRIGGSPLRPPQPGRPETVREGLLLCEQFGVEFRLRSSDKVIGRDPARADLIIEHPTISRRHAHVYLQHGRHVMVDLGSTNGIHFRHKRVHSLVLRDGMRLRIGRVAVQYLVTRRIEPAAGG